MSAWHSEVLAPADARRLREARAQGRGAAYQPWLRAREVPSRGLTTRSYGWTTGRVHHVFSNLELAYFYTLDWDPHITDIREQYPLLPLDETLAIAAACGFRHPTVPRTRYPAVMTTDFVITRACHLQGVEHARTLKFARDLGTPRTLEKLEIERRYWQTHAIDWAIVTECEISPVFAANVARIHGHRDLTGRLDLPVPQIRRIAAVLTQAVQASTAPLSRVTSTTDAAFALAPGTSLALAYHLLATRQWQIDMHCPLHPGRQLVLLSSTVDESIYSQGATG